MARETLEALLSINERKTSYYNSYAKALQTARNTSPMIPPEHRLDFFTPVAWCRLVCSVIEERINLDTITTDDDAATEYLRGLLKANGGDELLSSVHSEALATGRAYIVPAGSARVDGYPVLQVVSAAHMVHAVDPATGQISEALQVYGPDGRHRAYYHDGQVDYLRNEGGNWVTDRPSVRFPGVPVFAFLNRGRFGDPFGRPEAKDIFRTQDSGTRVNSDMVYTSSSMAVPQRIISGSAMEDFAPGLVGEDGEPVLDEDGDQLPDIDRAPNADALYTSRLLLLGDAASKVAEFTAAQLQNFTTALNSLRRDASSISGAPASMFGIASDANPASAEAQQEDNGRLITRAERIRQGFAPEWTRLFEYLSVVAGYPAQVNLRWTDASMPNSVARADGVQKLATIKGTDGNPLFTNTYLLRQLGVPEEDIEEMQAEREVASLAGLLTAPAPTPPAV